MSHDTLNNLIQDVQLAEQRFVRREIDLAAIAPFDRALLLHLDRMKSWDRPSSGSDEGRTIARVTSRAHDREIRSPQHQRSFIPGAPDAPSLTRHSRGR